MSRHRQFIGAILADDSKLRNIIRTRIVRRLDNLYNTDQFDLDKLNRIEKILDEKAENPKADSAHPDKVLCNPGI